MTAAEGGILEIVDHAVGMVVEQQDLDRQAERADGVELAEVHAEAAVAIDHEHAGVGIGADGADGGRKAEAHGAETAGGDEAARMAHLQILGGEHLVVADAGRDEDVLGQTPVEQIHRLRLLDEVGSPILLSAAR